jgi:glycosyltransferase involved in cell wall biosynthesis
LVQTISCSLNVTNSVGRITVIVPYYNERENLPYLLEQISVQTHQPNEVILVDSGGSDGSSRLIDNWIDQQRTNIQFRNLHASTHTPGGSKSAGVKTSHNDLIAFMDCGLSFPTEWLQRQSELLTQTGADWVSGVCLTKGTTLVDKAAIAHTYGFETARPVIPGSLIRRDVFDKIGLFKDLRAGYDAEWARASERAGLRREVNHTVIMEYRGVNFAADLSGVFLKSLRYARPSAGRDDTPVPYIYFLGLIMGVLAMLGVLSGLLSAAFLAIATVLYLVSRLTIASRKSRGFRSLVRNPLQLVIVCIVAVVMDAGKAVGFTAGLFIRFGRRRLPVT